MRLKPEQLAASLEKGLLAAYVISGDEPLQMQESADLIRAQARRQDYADRTVFNVEKGFDWHALLEAGNSLSLFAERRLLEVRLSGKPDEAGGKVLAEYAERPPEDTVLLLSCGKLDKNVTERANWFKALDRIGAVVQVWPVDARGLPEWIQRRMRARGLEPSREAVAMLSERVEGNLLAAAQEIEKLLLLYGAGRVDADRVAASVADSSRFDVFGLVDAALAGQAERVARMLLGLRGEGVAPLPVAWALTREIRALTAMVEEMAGGANAEAVLARHRVWERRKPLLKAALRRHARRHWYDLLLRCGQVERTIKGAAAGNAWDELLQLGLDLSGVAPLAPRQELTYSR